MYLRNNQRLLQYLTIQHLDIDITNSFALQHIFRQCIQEGWLQGLNLLMRGFFLEKTLNTHHDVILCSHILCQFFTILVIELSNQSLGYPIDTITDFTFLQDDFTLLEFHRHQNALQYIQLIMCHRAVASGQFTCHVSCCQSNCSHTKYFVI